MNARPHKKETRPYRKQAPRSNDLLKAVERELKEGWSMNMACKRAGTNATNAYRWAQIYPEWRVVVRMGGRKR